MDRPLIALRIEKYNTAKWGGGPTNSCKRDGILTVFVSFSAA